VQLTAGGASAVYRVSAFIPSGSEGSVPHNLAGLHLLIDYDESKIDASCPQSTNPGGFGEIICNAVYSDGGNLKVSIVFATLVNTTTGVGYTNAHNPLLAEITFSAKAGAPNTANAILGVQIVGCLNGASQAINCSQTLGSLQIGSAGPAFPWGDVNCSGSVNAADVVGVRRDAVGLPIVRPVDCNAPTDLNCSGVTNASDVVVVRRISVGLPNTLPPNCGT
jgi:hypothetical protein